MTIRVVPRDRGRQRAQVPHAGTLARQVLLGAGMQHRRSTLISLFALVLVAPGCSMLGSLGAAVPGGSMLTQGLSAGLGQLVAKRQQCNAARSAAATAVGLDPAAAPATMGTAMNAQAAVGLATAVISNNMCSRADRRRAKRAAKRAARRGEPLPTVAPAVAPTPTVAPAPSVDAPPTQLEPDAPASGADGIVDPYAMDGSGSES